MYNPVISVIIPCYNSDAYISLALESFYKQNYDNWEAIIINDGSTDNTEKILKKFAQKDHRIRIFYKPNGGYTSAINMGLNKINGDYFMIMGSDDLLIPDFFSKIAKYLYTKKYDFVGFKTVINKNGVLEDDLHSNIKKEYCFNNIDIVKLEKLKFPNFLMCFNRDTSKLFKTQLLKNQYYYGKFGYDSDGVFSTIFCHKSKNFLFIPNVGYQWNKRNSSLSSVVDNPLYFEDRLVVWSNFFKKILCAKPFLWCDVENILLDNAASLIIKYRKTYKINFNKERFLRMILKQYHSYLKILKKHNIAISKKTRVVLKSPLAGIVLFKLLSLIY